MNRDETYPSSSSNKIKLMHIAVCTVCTMYNVYIAAQCAHVDCTYPCVHVYCSGMKFVVYYTLIALWIVCDLKYCVLIHKLKKL